VTPIFSSGAAGNIFLSVLGILVMVLAGYLAAKKSLITQGGIGELSKIVFNISIPSLILAKMLTSYKPEMFFASLYLPLFAVINILFVNYLLALASARMLSITGKDRNVYLYLNTFQNYTYMPLPLVAMLFGPDKMIYVILFGVAGDILNYTVGIKLFNEKRPFFSWKLLSTPALAATLLGFAFVFLKIQVPAGLIKPVAFLGDITVPLAMIVTGGVAAGIKLKDAFKIITEKKMVALVLLKLIITPLVILLLTIPFHMNPVIRAIIVLQASMPSAFAAIIFSKQYGKNADLAAAGALVTTVLSALTVPVIFSLL